MSRAFISLYLSIVVSIIFLGWFADQVWKNFNPELDLSNLELSFFEMLQFADDHNINVMLKNFNLRSSRSTFELVDLDDFAQSSLLDKIKSGKTVSIFQHDGMQRVYRRVRDTQSVIFVSVDQTNSNTSGLYFLILFVFYLLMAMIIYFWIWPLTRDINKLKRKTQIIGQDGVLEKIHIGSSSVVADLASSFNLMADRIRELIASHKDMTSAVSHELRTPLARMRFAIELAENKLEDNASVVAKQIRNIKIDVEEMDALIAGLLNYAGYEHYSKQLIFESGDICSMVNNLIVRRFGDHNLPIDFTCEASLNVFCEWNLMEHCVHNVIQNALKYGRSKIKVSVTIERVESVEHCSIIVEDDGDGIDEQSRGRVLEPFVRLSNHKNKSGFGLGLAIVKRIMDWHQGEIHIGRSQMGGAMVSLRWPFERSLD